MIVEQDADPLPVSPTEQRALELYDQIQELRLEIAIIKAQQSMQDDDIDEDMTAEAADTARQSLLHTRSLYQLRNQAITHVLSTDPVLKAIHNGTEASPVERDLLPYIQNRDSTSLRVATSTSSVAKLRSQSTDTQTEALGIAKENVALAGEVMELVGRVSEKKRAYQDDESTMARLRKLEDEMKGSRRRWRIMKGITSGVITGSGVDWGRDEKLIELVLDPEEE